MKLDHIIKIANTLEEIGTPAALTAANAVEMAAFDNSEVPDIIRVAANLAAFANAFDRDGHQKVADLIDHVLFSFAEDVDRSLENLYDAEHRHNKENLYEGYHPTKVVIGPPAYEGLKGFNGATNLLSRHSPEMPGVSLARVSDGVYQDVLTKKIYDFNRGWVGEDGRKYPGGSVAAQTPSAQDWTGSFPRALEGTTGRRPS